MVGVADAAVDADDADAIATFNCRYAAYHYFYYYKFPLPSPRFFYHKQGFFYCPPFGRKGDEVAAGGGKANTVKCRAYLSSRAGAHVHFLNVGRNQKTF